MNDLGAPHRKTVIVERGSEKAVAHFDKNTWWIGPTHLTLKEQLDFTPTKWYEVLR